MGIVGRPDRKIDFSETPEIREPPPAAETGRKQPSANRIQDLRVPRSNRFHELTGDRKGQFSISVNDQWRICFRFADGDAFKVELTDCQ